MEENETEKQEEKNEEKPPVKKDDKKSLIIEAKEAAVDLRLANGERLKIIEEEKKLIERKEALVELGGDSYAGKTEPKKETEDEKWAKGAKERYEGTGLDPTPINTPTTYS